MATYEVENIFYNNYGGVQTKSCDLFATKNQALKHMKKLTNQRYGLKQRGEVKDGEISFTDDNGKVKERIIFGEI
jgi:hypothetical protein|tara:strand:- start:1135 stop:1359 length:225 start_codon:yes stop_codon:yes gene_type:complete